MEKRMSTNGVVHCPIILLFIGFLGYFSVYLFLDETSHYVSVPYVLLDTNSSLFNASQFSSLTLLEDDASRLINLTNFKFIINSRVCNESNPFVVTLVHSATGNIDKRNGIRRTWGGGHTDVMRVLFLLAQPTNINEQKEIEKESERFHDLIQGNFLDTYRNLSYKHVMGLKWISYYCPGAKYVLKTDDDMLVNTPAFFNFLNTTLSPYGARRFIGCKLYPFGYAQRSYRSKWRVSFYEYREKYYPPFCAGWFVLYSPDVVFNLYREAQKADYFWIDDVLVTGILTQRNNYRHYDMTWYINHPSPWFPLFIPSESIVDNIYVFWKKIIEKERIDS